MFNSYRKNNPSFPSNENHPHHERMSGTQAGNVPLTNPVQNSSDKYFSQEVGSLQNEPHFAKTDDLLNPQNIPSGTVHYPSSATPQINTSSQKQQGNLNGGDVLYITAASVVGTSLASMMVGQIPTLLAGGGALYLLSNQNGQNSGKHDPKPDDNKLSKRLQGMMA